jgi:hypothetical protein
MKLPTECTALVYGGNISKEVCVIFICESMASIPFAHNGLSLEEVIVREDRKRLKERFEKIEECDIDKLESRASIPRYPSDIEE